MRISKKMGLVAVGAAAAGVFLAAPAEATRPPSLTVSPATMAEGGAITVSVYCVGGGTPTSPVTSPGFAAPITAHALSTGQLEYTGKGSAGHRTGEFTASVSCPNWSPPITATFTVTAGPSTPPVTSPSSPGGTATKKPATTTVQVSRVPSGAAQTGGGGSAS
jgi:hypothetical protein